MPVLSSRIVGSDRKRFDFNDSSICLPLAAIYFLKSIPEGEIGGASSLLGVDPSIPDTLVDDAPVDEAKDGDVAADDTETDDAAVEDNAVDDASADDAAVGGIMSG